MLGMRSLGMLLLLCSTACDSDLTCEVLADPEENCWAKAAGAMKACLPADAQGVLASDRGSCSFADGSRVVFETPLPSDTFSLDRLAFTVEKDGAECGRFVDTFGNRMELSAGGTSAVSELHPGGDFHLHCGGTTYASDFDLLFTCPGGTAPTDGFDVQASRVEFTIVSVSSPGVLFTCAP
jgi:hypothetical protein